MPDVWEWRGRAALTSVHISFTFSRIMLQCLSKAFTRPSSFLLFRQLMSTCKRLSAVSVKTFCSTKDRGCPCITKSGAQRRDIEHATGGS